MIDEKTLRKTIAANVIRLRKEKGWLQQELANRAGASRVSVNRLENGHTMPTAELLYSLADALGTTTDALRQVTDVSLGKPAPPPVPISEKMADSTETRVANS